MSQPQPQPSTLLLPPGLLLTPLTLETAAGPLEWWRCEDRIGRILGSGFTAAEAAELARREVGRRG